MTTIPGEIRQCAHCNGSGECPKSGTCAACKIKAGLDPSNNFYDIPCSVCGGKGAVWIGPEVVQEQAEK
jgi:hypothetical protein